MSKDYLFDDMEEEIEELRDKIATLEEENKQLRSDAADGHFLADRRKEEIETLKLKIEYLESRNEGLESELSESRRNGAKYKAAYSRLNDLCETLTNKLLRQTIAGLSHGKRNIQLRDLAWSIQQILSIADDDAPDNIPF